MRLQRLGSLAIVLFTGPAIPVAAATPVVEAVRVPDGGIQPQALVDAKGAIHLIAFRGDPAAGDLYYARRDPDGKGFGEPVRINRNPGGAIAVGTIRGGQLALGQDGTVHVAWNGSNKAVPKNAFGSNPMLYARSTDGGKSFEPERNLMTKTSALDGGGCLAADAKGNVLVAWHARTEDSAEGEDGRRVWVARSKDDGKAFAPEEPADDGSTGACGCCGMKALADGRGGVSLLFRSASRKTDRDLYLLRSDDRGAHFRAEMLHPWKLKTCPMASASLVDDGSATLAAWETDKQVYFARIGNGGTKPIAPTGPGRGRKHPSIAVNSKGQILLAWAEGTGWQHGGDLVWQAFEADGTSIGEPTRVAKGIPAWGLPAAVALPDGSFLVLH